MRSTLLSLLVLLGGCHLLFPHAQRGGGGDGARPADVAPLPDRAQPEGPPHPEARVILDGLGTCSLACDSCLAGTCFITTKCKTGCTCPAGMACQVECAAGSCQGDIDCSQAKDCNVNCAASFGTSACQTVRCGTGTCTVLCFGTVGPACTGGVDCSSSSGCDVTCNGAACGSQVKCGTGACTTRCSAGAKTQVSCGGSSPCCVSNLADSTCTAPDCPCAAQLNKPCWCAGCK